MKRFWLALALIGSLAPAAVRAQAEQIESFDSTIEISPQNVATITETIAYDFGSLERHGIFRLIPIDYRDDRGNRYYLNFKLLSVSDGQRNTLPVKQTSANGNVSLRIGDPDQTINGRHTYQIQYQLFPLITKETDSDRLAIDITGEGWQVPILVSRARLILPQGVGPQSMSCRTGSFGSAAADCSVSLGDKPHTIALQSNAPLSPGQNLSLFVDLPDGSFSNYLEPNIRRPVNWRALLPVITSAALLVLSLGYLLAGLVHDHRRKRRQTVIAQYESPDGLTPAEVGLLIDDRASMVEVTATLIDLAVKGYIKVEQTAKPAWYRRAKYRLHKLKDFNDLPSPEASLLATIFAGNQQIDLNRVDRQKVPAAIDKFKKTVSASLKKKGYYAANPPGHLAVFSRRTIFVWLYAASFLASFISGVTSKSPAAGPVIVLSIIAAIIFIFARLRPRVTSRGLEQWADAKGFQLFLSVAEKDRLNFTDAPERTPQLFSQLLPYAVALGVEKQWAKQFAHLDLAQTAGWYASPYHAGHFSSAALAGDLSSGFSQAVSSGFAAPSSSGGGGGSSGGGFGGGGGGSW